jgi:hypothetical protein
VTVIARNATKAVLGPGGVCICLESVSQFCVSAFGGNLASVTMKTSSHLIYFIKKIYRFYTSSVIYRDNAAINFIAVKLIKVSFLSTLTGHMLVL